MPFNITSWRRSLLPATLQDTSRFLGWTRNTSTLASSPSRSAEVPPLIGREEKPRLASFGFTIQAEI